MTCTVCGGAHSRPYIEESGHTIVRCCSCGHVYENPIDLSEVHDRYIQGENWIDSRALTVADFHCHPRGHIYRFALGVMQEHSLLKGRILEIGCSRGHFLQFMHSHGYGSWGVEPGEDALAAEQIAGVRVLRTFVEDFQPDVKFQGVFFLDVLEHIPNPHLVLEKAFEWLDTPGIVVAMVPNLTIQQLRVFLFRAGLRAFGVVGRSGSPLSAGNHINHFSARTLRMLFQCQPFVEVRICNSPIDLQYIRGLPRWWAPGKRLYWRLAGVAERIFGIQLAGSITAIGLKGQVTTEWESPS